MIGIRFGSLGNLIWAVRFDSQISAGCYSSVF